MKMKKLACFAAVVTVVGVGVFLAFDDVQSGPEVGAVGAAKRIAEARPSRASSAAAEPWAFQLASNQTATVRGTKPYVLTCESGFAKPQRVAAEALGVRTVAVLSRTSLLVEADGASLSRVAADGRFAVEGEFLPSEKVSPELAAAIAAGAKDVEVSVVTLTPEDRQYVLSRLQAQGGELLKGCLNEGGVVRAKLPAGLVSALAAQGDVRWMEKFERPHLMNDLAVNPGAMNVRSIWKSETNLDGLSGAGQAVSTSDSGIDTGDLATLHADLKERVKDIKVVEFCNPTDSNGHGTHTAGSIVGDGTMSGGQIRGTAWGADLYAWFCGGAGGNILTPETKEELFRGDEEGAAWPTFIHSASWGSDQKGAYTTRSKEFDQYVWEHPDFLPVVAAGNAGNNGQKTVSSPASAKNVLAVGATQNLRSDGKGALAEANGDPSVTAEYSSRGPCQDGRIKPDIAAPGTGILSTRSSGVDYSYGVHDEYYAYDTGTSMACPLTAGAVALVREWLMTRKGFTDEKPPTAALMKAVITGGAAGGACPTKDQGWGRVDLAETLFPSNRAVKLFDRIPFEHGKEFAWIVETTNAAPLDVQLAWVDYPGEAGGRQDCARLVNDLDLTVSPLDGDEFHYGNGGSSPDRLNNLETVRLASAAANRYLVTVSCTHIVQDWNEGGAAALYVRGAFDPDTVAPYQTVRVVKPSGEAESYFCLDKALKAAADGDVIEILDATELRESVVLTNAFALTVTATNANPRLAQVVRRDGADIRVEGGSLFFSNVVFKAEPSTPVRAVGSGVVKVAGIAVFDDLVSGTPGIQTDGPQRFELAGPLENGITVACNGASRTNNQFGVYTCSPDEASASAPLLVSAAGEDRAGVADGAGALRWADGGVVDPKVAVGYVGGDEPVYCRTLDQLFDKSVDGAEVVITKSGSVIRKPQTLSGVRSISAAGDAGEVVVRAEGSAGFTLDAGCELTVSGLVFEGYRGNGLFVVNGADAKLTVTNSVFSDIEGTNMWSGAIVVRKGLASVIDSVFYNCRATGAYRSNGSVRSRGGAVYLAGEGCALELDGGLISNCSAKSGGGGVYAAAGSVVRVCGALTVKGNCTWSADDRETPDDIQLANTNAVLELSGKLEGEDAVGVRYGAVSASGNDVGDVFAVVGEGVSDSDAASSAKAFFCDVDPETKRAEVDGSPAEKLRWAERPAGDKSVSAADPDATVRVTKGGEARYYVRPDDAFEWVDADATVEVLKGAGFAADLVVTNGIKVTLKSADGLTNALARTGACRICVASEASLVATNVVLDGNGYVADIGLVAVEHGSFELQAGAVVKDAWGAHDRLSGAVVVRNGGTFTMRSGAEISNCRNSYFDPGSKASCGGGVLVEDHSKAYLLGGRVIGCEASRGGGVFIGSKSTVYVGGELSVTNNVSTQDGAADNLCVSDLSELFLKEPLTGTVGYSEGRSGDTNVFGRVDASFSGDTRASARCFRHDVTGDYGVSVKNGSDTLLVWGNALDAGGKFNNQDGKTYDLVAGAAIEIPLPEGRTNLVYNAAAQVGLEDGVGYVVVSGAVATNAADYVAVIKARPGFAIEDGATGVDWKINPATFDLVCDTDVTFESKTFVYDGTEKSLALSGTLPGWLKVEYENNGRTQLGTNKVSAIITGANPNYVPNPFAVTNYADLVIVESAVKDPGQKKDDPVKPDPYTVKTNTALPIAFSEIVRVSDGRWRLVVTDLVEQAEYAISSASDLQTGFTTGSWYRAASSGAWTNTYFVEAAQPALFWRAHGRTTYVTNYVDTLK